MAKKYVKIFLLTITLIICNQSFAQIKTFDSLFKKLASYPTNDTNYINTLSLIGVHYQHKSMDSLIIIGDRIINLSSQINHIKGIANGNKLKGIAYIKLQKKDLALYHDSIAIANFEKINDMQGIGAVYNNMAVLFNTYGEYHSANIYYNKCITYREKSNDIRGIADTYSNMANNLLAVGEYGEALKYMLKGLTIRKQIKDVEAVGNSYANIGGLYYLMKDNVKSEEYLWKSFNVRKSIGSTNELGNIYLNLGSIQIDKHNYDSAKNYFEKAIKIGNNNNDNEVILTALNNIIEIALLQHKYTEAFNTINLTEKYINADIDNENKIEFNIKKAAYYTSINEYNKGIKFGINALNTSIKIGSKQYIVISSLALSNTYEKNGNATEALTYYKLSKQYSDSIYNEENLTKFNDYQYKFNLQAKENEIIALESSKKTEEDRYKKLQLGFALLLAILLGISILTYSVNGNRKKQERINTLTSKQKETLEQHNIYKDKVFSIIAHDLRSPVASLQGMFNLLESGMITKDDFMSLSKDMSNQVSTLSLLLDNLLIWAKNQMTSGFQTNRTNVSINKIINQNKQLFNEIASKKGVLLDTIIADEISLNADADQIDLIIRNLVSNAIKFTNKEGTVSIIANQTKDTVTLKIKDTGIGMKQATIDKIYTNNVISQNGTNGEKGTGLGINLTKEFIENNQGTFAIESTLGVGTEITITFKKA